MSYPLDFPTQQLKLNISQSTTGGVLSRLADDEVRELLCALENEKKRWSRTFHSRITISMFFFHFHFYLIETNYLLR